MYYSQCFHLKGKNKQIQFGRKLEGNLVIWRESRRKFWKSYTFKNLNYYFELFLFTFGKANLKICLNKIKPNWWKIRSTGYKTGILEVDCWTNSEGSIFLFARTVREALFILSEFPKLSNFTRNFLVSFWAPLCGTRWKHIYFVLVAYYLSII